MNRHNAVTEEAATKLDRLFQSIHARDLTSLPQALNDCHKLTAINFEKHTVLTKAVASGLETFKCVVEWLEEKDSLALQWLYRHPCTNIVDYALNLRSYTVASYLIDSKGFLPSPDFGTKMARYRSALLDVSLHRSEKTFAALLDVASEESLLGGGGDCCCCREGTRCPQSTHPASTNGFGKIIMSALILRGLHTYKKVGEALERNQPKKWQLLLDSLPRQHSPLDLAIFYGEENVAAYLILWRGLSPNWNLKPSLLVLERNMYVLFVLFLEIWGTGAFLSSTEMGISLDSWCEGDSSGRCAAALSKHGWQSSSYSSTSSEPYLTKAAAVARNVMP